MVAPSTTLGYLDELIALDKETSKLRTDTDKIVSNEKANTFDVIAQLDKKYSSFYQKINIITYLTD